MRAIIVGLAAAVAAVSAGAAKAACGPGDLSGLYEGSADVPGGGQTDVTLNLACAPGGYKARLVTGMGEFAVKDLEVGAGQVKFSIDTGASLGTVDLKPDADG